ncbi:uncharacterized protein SPPG_02379 [Spizellomyces punctatus DAOM BR117]|uniref:RRM domain-containing protein n=1 Tax=Spizellomyces punctatus (strain DAOM BR117) TaxID=645134 RepID=A0A0L0HQW6_SPIPD|nr:uncharacterized protein SPPG_02379 [Spizellomyces punctatus DAOM BR117]KND03335.1 hypothetical protein SPPG_02379 [Spizellomyces punctatus DAOM BR117]|eukprot:XP_016611374.1 hypothetical protein SPPG_02379 [Spizellomyces punctatus DAOM BR117]
MSRLIVKNLPKHYTLDRFKEHFSEKGEVTDAKLVKTPDGVFRRFGYIGFKTEKQAKDALKYFNNTFVDTSKIQVELAKAIGDASLPRPWSRHSHGSSAFDRKTQAEAEAQRQREERQDRLRRQKEETQQDMERKQKLLNTLYADEHDPKLKEFLEVMRPRSSARGRTWANDDVTSAQGTANNGGKKNRAKATVLAVPNKKTGGDGMLVTKTHVTFEDSEDELYDELPSATKDNGSGSTKEGTESAATMVEEDVETETVEDASKQRNSAAHDSSLSDLDYLRSKMRNLSKDEDEEIEAHEDSGADVGEDDDDSMDVDKAITPTDIKSSSTIGAVPSKIHASRMALFDNEDDIETPAPIATTQGASNTRPPPSTVSVPKAEQGPPPAELIADTGRLFVKNLPYTCTVEDLHKLFEKFGPLSEVHIPIEKETKKPKGFAFILYLLPEHAVKAFTTLDGQIFQGRILEVLPGKEKPRPVDDEENSSQTFKNQREKQRKANAGNEFSWNSLFMNSDAVAEAMARKLGVKKSDILNPDAENMAVRLALAETHIITETKQYLEEEGIDLSAFEKRKTRSKSIILVKNIPHDTEEEELRELFGKFGTIGRLVLPPAKTIALVEFLELNEAKAAFQRLAYTKFKHLPLYLEWAPVDTFKKKYDPTEVAERRNKKETQKEDKTTTEDVESEAPRRTINELASADDATEDPDAMPIATLFVKNLNFETNEERLREAFKVAKGLRSVRVATKLDKKTGGKLSMGFGFLEFNTKEDAMRCIKSMQNFKLDGHSLELKISNAAAKSTAPSKKRGSEEPIKVTGTKLIVRNIPFEATKKDIRQLFSTFGQVKSVRIPRKMDGNHRGFGFVDFLTKQEAKSAFESLAATHLYGRHLVLEWAEDVESVEAMRSKTARGFFKDDGPNKKRKIVMDDEGEEDED